MSTDDLTKALWIAGPLRGFADPSARERALVVLADEVERLRATEGVCTHQNAQYLTMKGERDAAQAVVDRVTDLVLNTPHAWVTVRELTHILRGQP